MAAVVGETKKQENTRQKLVPSYQPDSLAPSSPLKCEKCDSFDSFDSFRPLGSDRNTVLRIFFGGMLGTGARNYGANLNTV